MRSARSASRSGKRSERNASGSVRKREVRRTAPSVSQTGRGMEAPPCLPLVTEALRRGVRSQYLGSLTTAERLRVILSLLLLALLLLPHLAFAASRTRSAPRRFPCPWSPRRELHRRSRPALLIRAPCCSRVPRPTAGWLRALSCALAHSSTRLLFLRAATLSPTAKLLSSSTLRPHLNAKATPRT
jgi:hypothetical protein